MKVDNTCEEESQEGSEEESEEKSRRARRRARRRVGNMAMRSKVLTEYWRCKIYLTHGHQRGGKAPPK